MKRDWLRRILFLACAVLVMIASGCGPRKFNVTGKVTYNNSVLDKPGGKIIFIGPNGEQKDADIGADGTYQVTGAIEGVNKVVVYYPNPRLQTDKPPKPRPGEAFKPNPPAFLTPERYADPGQTPFEITLDKDTVFDAAMDGMPIQ